MACSRMIASRPDNDLLPLNVSIYRASFRTVSVLLYHQLHESAMAA